jgi:hypothetical protein
MRPTRCATETNHRSSTVRALGVDELERAFGITIVDHTLQDRVRTPRGIVETRETRCDHGVVIRRVESGHFG